MCGEGDHDEDPHEFATEEEATACMDEHPFYQAYPSQVLEVDI